VINIVLLGETGIGKTTLINAFGNYIVYNSYNDVINSKESVSLVNTRFSYQPKYEDQEMGITIGNPREDRKTFFSDTKDCMSYLFRFIEDGVEYQIRLIDTPGLFHVEKFDEVDECDDTFIKMTIDQLSMRRFVDAYLLLLSPTNARYTERFRYCVERMMAELDNKAEPNLVFGYTKCFPNFETAPETKMILKEIGFQVDNKPDFFFENTPTRVLAVLQNGHIPIEQQSYLEIQWDESLQQYAKLISTVIGLPSHVFEVTIQKVRQKIEAMLPFLLECTLAAEFTLNEIRVATKNKKRDYLEKKALWKRLDSRRVVCTNNQCSELEVTNEGGCKIFKMKYKSICCGSCIFRLGIWEHTTNLNFLFLCKSMEFEVLRKQYVCQVCSHPTSEHMQISYELSYKQSKCENLKEKKLDLEEAKHKMLICFALAHHFLKENTLIMNGNPLIKRIEKEIQFENEKIQPDLDRRKNLQQIKDGLKLAIGSKDMVTNLTANEINRKLEDLKTIPEYGDLMQQLFNEIDQEEVIVDDVEEHFIVPDELPRCSLEKGLKMLSIKETAE